MRSHPEDVTAAIWIGSIALAFSIIAGLAAIGALLEVGQEHDLNVKVWQAQVQLNDSVARDLKNK